MVPIFYSIFDDLRRLWSDFWGAVRHGRLPRPEPDDTVYSLEKTFE